MHKAPRLSRWLEKGALTPSILLTLAMTVTGFTGAAAVSVGATTAPKTSACTTSGLDVWFDTEGSGTAGSTYYELQFTNLSGRACSLQGDPGVSAVNLGGRQLGSAASRNNVHPPKLIVLANGASASAIVQIVDVGNFPIARCKQLTAAGLRVYPPNQTSSKVVAFPLRACARSGPIYLTVQPVRHS